jgi:hypothetical protein
MVPPV